VSYGPGNMVIAQLLGTKGAFYIENAFQCL